MHRRPWKPFRYADKRLKKSSEEAARCSNFTRSSLPHRSLLESSRSLWIGDIVKKGDLLVRWDDRLIQATLDANRQYVQTSNVKIKNETRQVERYTALAKQNMGTP